MRSQLTVATRKAISAQRSVANVRQRKQGSPVDAQAALALRTCCVACSAGTTGSEQLSSAGNRRRSVGKKDRVNLRSPRAARQSAARHARSCCTLGLDMAEAQAQRVRAAVLIQDVRPVTALCSAAMALGARANSLSRRGRCGHCASRSAAASLRRSLARRLAGRLVRRPVLQLMLTAAVRDGLAGAALLVVARVQLARSAAAQRAAAQRRRSQTGFSGCIGCRRHTENARSACIDTALLQDAAARKALPQSEQLFEGLRKTIRTVVLFVRNARLRERFHSGIHHNLRDQ